MIAAARLALVFEAVQWPPLAETVGVSDGLHRHQPNNRLRSTEGGSNAPYCHSETRGRPRAVQADPRQRRQDAGLVPNLHRLMSISPNALSGWAIMMRSFAKTLDVKTRDGIALAVSEADGCDYCLAAHSFIAGNLGKIPADEIELNREGRSSDPKRQAAVAFAKALIETRGKVSDAQFAAVRDAGVDRRQHRRDDRADCPVPVDQLHEQCGADPDRFSRGQSREGSLTRGALLWRGDGWRIQYLDGPRGPV